MRNSKCSLPSGSKQDSCSTDSAFLSPGSRLRQLRIDHGMSQKYLASILYCSQRTYSRYERGESKIPLPLLTQLATFYHTSVDYLVGVTDVMTAFPAGRNCRREE